MEESGFTGDVEFVTIQINWPEIERAETPLSWSKLFLPFSVEFFSFFFFFSCRVLVLSILFLSLFPRISFQNRKGHKLSHQRHVIDGYLHSLKKRKKRTEQELEEGKRD